MKFSGSLTEKTDGIFAIMPTGVFKKQFCQSCDMHKTIWEASENSDSKEYIEVIWTDGMSFSGSGKRIFTSLETEDFSLAHFLLYYNNNE